MLAHWVKVRRAVTCALILLPSAVLTGVLMALLPMAALSIVVGGVGIVLLPLLLQVLRAWTDAHRALAGHVLGERIRLRSRLLRGGVFTWWRDFLGDPTTWRDLVWLPLQLVVGLPLGLFALLAVGGSVAALAGMFLWWLLPSEEPVTLLPGLPITDWPAAVATGLPVLAAGVLLTVTVLPAMATAWAMLTRAVLDRSGTERLEHRVHELTESRAGALDVHGAELRRIERDLHDGTQAKLVSIALRLGIARQALETDLELAATLLREASEGTEAAMGELRSIVRTIYPPILTDRGLVGALRALVVGSPVPTRTDLSDVGRLPVAVQTAAYFVVSEALSNTARHSGATSAEVAVHRVARTLRIRVSDDGRGGIDESKGSGVQGIRRRVAALDGRVSVHSPPGGPSTITVELPCGH